MQCEVVIACNGWLACWVFPTTRFFDVTVGFEKQNDPLSSPMLRVEFQDPSTGKAVKVPLFFLTWYDFDSDRNENAVESMCIERSQFDPKQSSFTANEYLGYVEVKASDTESIKNYLKKAFPRRQMLSDADLAKLGQRLDDTACFVGACVCVCVRVCSSSYTLTVQVDIRSEPTKLTIACNSKQHAK